MGATFKVEKPPLESIHSGHFMVSTLDDDEENNNEGDDSSSQGEDNAGGVEIDVSNLDGMDGINYTVDSELNSKNEQVTSWNDLDKPQNKHYIVYYTSRDRHGAETSNEQQQNIYPSTQPSKFLSSTPGGNVQVYNNPHNPSTSCSNVGLNNVIATSRHLESDIPMAFNQQNNVNYLLQHQQSTMLTMQSSLQQIHASHQPHIFIDATLTKLLECMSLYYSSKLTSPKWKSFKGSNLRLKKKIRLNNLIWRAWFLQYMRGKQPPGCQFVAPVDPDVHKKSETIVLEGKYWKRKVDAIVHEYQKWRRFHKQKIHINCFRPSSFDWDSRVYNLRSTQYDCNFYSDYDMNMPYNFDDLPPTIEEIETREDSYCNTLAPTTLPAAALNLPNSLTLPPNIAQPSTSNQQEAVPLKKEHNSFNRATSNSAVPTKYIDQYQNFVNKNPVQFSHQQQTCQFHNIGLNQAPLIANQNFAHQQQQPAAMMPVPMQLTSHMPNPINLQSNHINNPLNNQFQQQSSFYHQPERQAISNQLLTSQPNKLHDQIQLATQKPQPILEKPLAVPSPSIRDSMNNSRSDSVSLSDYSETKSDQRRAFHINAEQKRRCNIKNGFDTLKSILPSINQNINIKISKAAMLQKAAQHIHMLNLEKEQQEQELSDLKKQIETLKQDINNYQCQLPATGAPVGCQNSSRAKEMLDDYVRRRTSENWKFWIFSLLVEPLFISYYNSVNTTSLQDSFKTIISWLSQSCGLVSLRHNALESLTYLSTKTNILSTPQTLPTEVVRHNQAINSMANTNISPANRTIQTNFNLPPIQQAQHSAQYQVQQSQQMPNGQMTHHNRW